MRLVRDSKGQPSWTVTIVIVVLIMTPLAVLTQYLTGIDMQPFLIQSWGMSVGAFMTRELATKVPAMIAQYKGKNK